jgi:predicted ArsR family transcriptional regulator
MEPERSEGGEFVESVTLDAVLGVFTDVEGPVVTSGDVADALGCSRETARRKLRQLHQEGRVSQRKTAGRVVWWLTEETGENTSTADWDTITAAEAADELVAMGEESSADVDLDAMIRDSKDAWSSLGEWDSGRNPDPDSESHE